MVDEIRRRRRRVRRIFVVTRIVLLWCLAVSDFLSLTLDATFAYHFHTYKPLSQSGIQVHTLFMQYISKSNCYLT